MISVGNIMCDSGQLTRGTDLLRQALASPDLPRDAPYVEQARARLASRPEGPQDPTEALTAARRVREPDRRIRALVSLALTGRETRPRAAIVMLGEAESLLPSVTDARARFAALLSVATGYDYCGVQAKVDQLREQAVKGLQDLPADESEAVSYVLAAFAGDLAESGDTRAVRQFVHRLRTTSLRDAARGASAMTFARRGECAAAVGLTSEIEDRDRAAASLRHIVEDFIMRHRYECAMEALEGLTRGRAGKPFESVGPDAQLVFRLGIAVLKEGFPAPEEAKWAARLRGAAGIQK